MHDPLVAQAAKVGEQANYKINHNKERYVTHGCANKHMAPTSDGGRQFAKDLENQNGARETNDKSQKSENHKENPQLDSRELFFHMSANTHGELVKMLLLQNQVPDIGNP